MAEAFICDDIRTPIGRYAGALKDVRADDLAAYPLRVFAAAQIGRTALLAEVREAARSAGAGSQPADLLIQLEAQGSSFDAWQKGRAET